MRIGVDLDDVVAVCCVPYLKRFAAEYGVELPDEDELGWHVLDHYESQVPARERDRFRRRTYDEGFFETLEPYADATEALERIVNAGHEIHFITARAERRRVVTEQWLRQKGLLNYARTVRLKPRGDFRPDAPPGRYDPYSSADYKVRVAKELHLDRFCEDDVVIAEMLAKAGVPVWLFDRPWNRELAHPNIRRVNGWDEVTAALVSPHG